MHKLDHRNSYEWMGTFWFPDKSDERFAGKLSYTPEQGISVFILNISKKRFGNKQKIIMHGVVRHDNESVPITLLETFFQTVGVNISTISSEGVKGSARALVFGEVLDKFNVSGLYIDYDDNFYQFFLQNKMISNIAKFADNPIVVNKANILLTIANATAQTVYSTDDLDDVLCVFARNSKRVMQDFKERVKPFLEQNKYRLLKRTETNIGVYIKDGYKKISKYRTFERIWRLYIEVLLDCQIDVNFCWVRIGKKRKEKISYRLCAMLGDDFRPNKVSVNKKLHHLFMPINLRAFSADNDLGTLNTSVVNWFNVYYKPGWNNIIQGIKEIVHREHPLIEQKDFVMLISYIETLQNLQGVPKNSDVDRFVIENLSSIWIKKIKLLLGYKVTQDKNLGNCLCEIRNAIVHPKSQNKNNGKYYKIANNEVKLQNIYGILAGAFIKVFIKEMYNIPDDTVEKYMDSFIKARSSYKYIKYNK